MWSGDKTVGRRRGFELWTGFGQRLDCTVAFCSGTSPCSTDFGSGAQLLHSVETVPVILLKCYMQFEEEEEEALQLKPVSCPSVSVKQVQTSMFYIAAGCRRGTMGKRLFLRVGSADAKL